MKLVEIKGNIWDYHKDGWIVITTNGFVKKNGSCVMGRGIALQSAQRFPELPQLLGQKIIESGNHVFVFEQYRIITLPVKHDWYEKADVDLIERSIKELINKVNEIGMDKIYLVRAGVGNGRLNWETQVKPLYERYLDERFIVVERRLSKPLTQTEVNIYYGHELYARLQGEETCICEECAGIRPKIHKRIWRKLRGRCTKPKRLNTTS